MDLIGQTVEHKTFGSGIVKELADGIVTVYFQSNAKKFIYPDAFHSFLLLKDQTAQQRIEEMIRDREAALKKTIMAAQKERERLLRLSHFKIAAKSHAIFHAAPEQIGQIAETWQISIGTYRGGYSRGLPRTAERIKPNSVCLLTACPGGKDERERRIIGLFMVREDFFGEDAHDGVIKAHRQHRILLPEEQQVSLWKYFSLPPSSRWGNTTFKYCSVEVVNVILADIAKALAASGQRDAMADFYRYFRKINRLCPLISSEEEHTAKAQ